MISVVTPAYNEAANLPALHAGIAQTMARLAMEWEWLVVDDHSRDGTFGVLQDLARRDPRVRGIRLARNGGSHAAIACALDHVSGDAAVMLAGDLQDPPETIVPLVAAWRRGAAVVWAARRTRPGDRAHARGAAIYYWIMRRVVGLEGMPASGADVFLVDRIVIDALRGCAERNVSLFALITWLGFRQETIEYDKQSRGAGRSGWTLRRKLKLVVDSVVSFSDLPIRLCWLGGAALVVTSLAVTAVSVWRGASGSGLLLLAALVIGLAGVQLLALGAVGEYVWRTLDEVRRRPAYVIEETTWQGRAHGAAIPVPHVE